MNLEDFPVIYTVGHSTRSLVDFLDLLSAAGVNELVDVRSVPRSRRHPHFSSDALARDLPARSIDYRHEPALGGFRRPTANSPNGGWQHQAHQDQRPDAANAVAFYLAHVGRHLRDFLVAGAKCEFVKADTLRRVTEALINLR